MGRAFARAFDRFGTPVAEALIEAGVPCRWLAREKLSERACLLSGRGQVLVARDRIVGGAAQHVTSAGLLHQIALIGRVDVDRHAQLFDLSPEATARLGGVLEGVPLDSLESVGRRSVGLGLAWYDRV